MMPFESNGLDLVAHCSFPPERKRRTSLRLYFEFR
jgi:hypothetical protein